MKRKLKNNWITKKSDSRLYNLAIPIIGLTGGIASGKSTIAELLRIDQHPILDADQLVKNIYKTQEARDFISSNFPHVINGSEINFKILRETFFSDHEARLKVETFIYQRLPQMFMSEFKKLNNPEYLFYDVPLLFEKEIHKKVDISVCVYIDKKTQIDRLMKRDQISKELALNIINKQDSLEAKKDLSDYVIFNNESLDNLKVHYQDFLNELFE